jgi:hypothetical protein
MSKIIYTDKDHVTADMNRLIEGGSETERTAARVLKMMMPLLSEVLLSHNLAKLAGLVRGLAMVVSSIIISLPENMRQPMAEAIMRDLEKALDLAKKGPPIPASRKDR